MIGRRWNVFGKLALCTVIESLAFVIPIAIASQPFPSVATETLRTISFPQDRFFDSRI
ncbi:MAG: hypothetical protein ACOX83_09865 [Candidatus Spyradocola sp.]